MSMLTFGLALVVTALSGPPAAAESPPGGDLIQVDVQVLEINKSKLYKVGLDWSRLLEGGAAGAASAAAGGPISPAELVEDAPPPLKRLGTFSRGQVDAFLHVIEGNNYGKLLAKPKLLTVSGSPATFLVGGEIPIVSQDTQGHTTVNWKEYGIRLQIKPERKDTLIRTHVRAEASTIDAANAVTLPNGTYMPALKTRWAETDVELASKSTVIIAGLIQTEDVRIMTGLPVLMDLPLLGWLFRHTRDEKIETELVIFVSPSFATAQAGTAGS
jgi:Flp pilus assembly secretin CpaC